MSHLPPCPASPCLLGARAIAILLGASVTLSGCNRRLFERVEPTCGNTIFSDVELPQQRPADILIVVDNSGSMREEQENLARNFVRDDDDCPLPAARLHELATCATDETPSDLCAFRNPSREIIETHGPGGLADCGFLQVLAAFDADFRVGVITTDVSACDNAFGQAEADACRDGDDRCQAPNRCLQPADPERSAVCESRAGAPETCAVDTDCPPRWGFRPQRGCLQPDGPPEAFPLDADGHRPARFISRQDLLDDDEGQGADVAARFLATLRNIDTAGSPEERGLDAALDFLAPPSPDRGPDPSCADHRDAFLRDDATLVLIFLTDEEDCSRLDDDHPTFYDPNTCGLVQSVNGAAAQNCYAGRDTLTDVETYAARLRAAHPEGPVKAAVIAGTPVRGLGPPQGAPTGPEGACVLTDVGAPGDACYPAEGFTTDATVCGVAPSDLDAIAGRRCVDDGAGVVCALPCCSAEAGTRYVALANALGDPDSGASDDAIDSICRDSFQEAMIRIAIFIADVGTLKLSEPPADPRIMFVEKHHADGDVEVLARLTTDGCEDQSGWLLESDGDDDLLDVVRLCGDARPQAGETIAVRARGAGAAGSDDSPSCDDDIPN